MTDNPPACVTLLGTKGGPAIRPESAMPTSSLVQMGGLNIIVDTGLGVTAGLCRAGLTLTKIDAVLITHLHSDHVLELGPLLHTAWTAGLKDNVPIYGPPGIEHYWEGFLNSMAFDIDLRQMDEGRPPFHELFPMAHIRDDRPIQIGDVRVTAMRNHHPPVKDSFALKLRTQDHCVVFSGDTAPMPEMIQFAKGADLLVHEAMLSHAVQSIVNRMEYPDDRLLEHILRSHTPASDVARIAASAGVKALALHHLIPSGEPGITDDQWRAAIIPHYTGPLYIGQDGMVLPLDGAA